MDCFRIGVTSFPGLQFPHLIIVRGGGGCAVIHGGQAGDSGQPAAVPFPSLLHVGFVSAVKVWEYVQIFPVYIIGALLEDKPGFPRPIIFGFRTGIVLVIRVVPHLGHRHGGGGQPVGAGAGVAITSELSAGHQAGINHIVKVLLIGVKGRQSNGLVSAFPSHRSFDYPVFQENVTVVVLNHARKFIKGSLPSV